MIVHVCSFVDMYLTVTYGVARNPIKNCID